MESKMETLTRAEIAHSKVILPVVVEVAYPDNQRTVAGGIAFGHHVSRAIAEQQEYLILGLLCDGKVRNSVMIEVSDGKQLFRITISFLSSLI